MITPRAVQCLGSVERGCERACAGKKVLGVVVQHPYACPLCHDRRIRPARHHSSPDSETSTLKLTIPWLSKEPALREESGRPPIRAPRMNVTFQRDSDLAASTIEVTLQPYHSGQDREEESRAQMDPMVVIEPVESSVAKIQLAGRSRLHQSDRALGNKHTAVAGLYSAQKESWHLPTEEHRRPRPGHGPERPQLKTQPPEAEERNLEAYLSVDFFCRE